MLGFAVVAIAIVTVGCAVMRQAWRRLDGKFDDSALVMLTGGAVTGVGLWLACHWLLALTHTLTREAVAALALACIAAACVVAWRRRDDIRTAASARAAMPSLALLPLFFWVVFILWRSTILPPLSHDALAYHLPKALLLARAHGFAQFVASDPRIAAFPFNYELLLADVLLLTGSDALTEWVSTAMFLLFLIAAAAVAQRWWSSERGTLAALLATSSAPVLLLHSGADKNDLMTNFFMVAALLFGARWCVHGGRTAIAVFAIAVAAGIGTKPNLAAAAFGLAPFLLIAAIRRVRPRDVFATGVFATAAFVLCGGWPYIAHWIASTRGAAPPGVGTQMGIPYGDWFNLWQFPLLLMMIPFSRYQNGVWAPWAREYWFWPQYELYWSHYGAVFTAAILFLPFALWRYRRQDVAAAGERQIASLAAVVAVLIMLPVKTRPIGFFGTYPRYFAFVLPFVYAWTVAPLAREWAARRAAVWMIAALAVVLSFYEFESMVNDRFAPIEFVVWARENPGTRMVWFMPSRAASVADRRAGPNETVAIDGQFDTWSWPAYGRDLSRPVIYLPQGVDPVQISPRVSWIVIDRSWSALWGNRGLTNMGNMWGRVGKGEPTPADVELFNKLQRDPHWALVFRNPAANQAVFRRKRA